MKHPVSGQGGIRWTARIGYAARGLFYLLGGLFSPLAGAGPGVESVGPNGALSKIIGWPFGETLVSPLRAALPPYTNMRRKKLCSAG